MGNVIALNIAGTNGNSDLVDRMAADLYRFEALGCESDAIRALMGSRRYGYRDIAMFVDDAMATARQAIVTAEMARAS